MERKENGWMIGDAEMQPDARTNKRKLGEQEFEVKRERERKLD